MRACVQGCDQKIISNEEPKPKEAVTKRAVTGISQKNYVF